MPIEPGASGVAKLNVSGPDTAIAARSGDVPVLSTPRVVALVEEASIEALVGQLPAGYTTVGSAVQLTHLAPVAEGASVTAEAVLDSIEGRRLIFKVTVSDDRGLVAAGYLTRVAVERSRFLEKVRS
jgi:predicted thioesterase